MSNRTNRINNTITTNTIIMISALVFAAVCFYNSLAIGGIFCIAICAYEAFFIEHLRNARDGWTVFDLDPETGEEVEYKVYPRI